MDAVRELDLVLTEIVASGVPVDVVPGSHDPTNANLPQRPLHPCLLPSSTRYVCGDGDGDGTPLLRRATNPYEAVADDDDDDGGGRFVLLGTDGRSVEDVRRYTTSSSSSSDGDGLLLSPLDALEQTWRCGHLAPTAPDSLPCLPFTETDPFVIVDPDNEDDDGRRRPVRRAYFCGTRGAFATRSVNDGACRLICVPSFADTGEIVLLDCDTLECEVVDFDERVVVVPEENDDGEA